MSADVAPSGNPLNDRVAALEAGHAAMGYRIGGLETSMGGLREDFKLKHAENRDSIHDLRNGQQILIDLIHKIDIKLARMAGYACGAGAMVAVIFKIIEHVWK